jgi:hypothetical protein
VCASGTCTRLLRPAVLDDATVVVEGVVAELDVDRHDADGDHGDAGERLLPRGRTARGRPRHLAVVGQPVGRRSCRARMDAASFFRGQRRSSIGVTL